MIFLSDMITVATITSALTLLFFGVLFVVLRYNGYSCTAGEKPQVRPKYMDTSDRIKSMVINFKLQLFANV